jgi:hypothetical protein
MIALRSCVRREVPGVVFLALKQVFRRFAVLLQNATIVSFGLSQAEIHQTLVTAILLVVHPMFVQAAIVNIKVIPGMWIERHIALSAGAADTVEAHKAHRSGHDHDGTHGSQSGSHAVGAGQRPERAPKFI